MSGYVTIAVICMAVAAAGTCWLRKRMSVKLYEAVTLKNRQDCVRILDNPVFKIVFSGYEYLCLRMNAAIDLHWKEMLDECRRKQTSVVMKKDSRESILFRMAACYVDWGCQKETEEVMEELKRINSVKALELVEKLYHIYIIKDDSYRQEMEREFQTESRIRRKLELAAYLSAQYENIGDPEGARPYLDYMKKNGKKERGTC